MTHQTSRVSLEQITDPASVEYMNEMASIPFATFLLPTHDTYKETWVVITGVAATGHAFPPCLGAGRLPCSCSAT